MIDPRAIDLHMHTTVSDGTDAPEEIIAHVKEAGLSLFSVTDHDAVRGCGVICSMLTKEDPRFITGAEFSCKDEKGKYHILGYGYDPTAPAMRKLVETGHGYRMKKVQARIEFLQEEFGFVFPQEELDKIYAMDNPGKPHIGNMMTRLGYTESKEEAITKYINQLHFASAYVRPEEAIEGILGAEGIPVLAHPSYGSGDQIIVGEEMEQRICRLKEYGLQGLEGFYSGFTGKLIREILSYAGKYGLYVTAGSDYHGSNKMVVLGDTNFTEEYAVPEGMERFLEDVNMAEISGTV